MMSTLEEEHRILSLSLSLSLSHTHTQAHCLSLFLSLSASVLSRLLGTEFVTSYRWRIIVPSSRCVLLCNTKMTAIIINGKKGESCCNCDNNQDFSLSFWHAIVMMMMMYEERSKKKCTNECYGTHHSASKSNNSNNNKNNSSSSSINAAF